MRWLKNGKWQEIYDKLVKQVREKSGKKPTPTVEIIDSQICKNCTKKGVKDMMPARKLKVGNII